jgi:cytochrome bd-type quinol oxidase subunit 2
MTFLLGVILTALAILFLLTTLALSTSGQLRHPVRVGAALSLVLILGLVLLSD